MKNYGDLCKKISSNRGAAMLIAILVCLLAMLSGTAALTMAASNAGRYTHEGDDQQAYLSVASAAKLILSKLESLTVEYKSTEKTEPKSEDQINITYYGSDYTIQSPGSSIPENTVGMFFSDPRFKAMLKTFSLNKSINPDDMKPVSFILTVNNAAEMGQVYVSLSLNGSDFSFRLYSMRGESSNYQITMKVPSSFDGFGSNNFQIDGGFYYRAMIFNTAEATFSVEKLTGETGE